MKSNSKKIYFIGIGGIGMSALARYFKHEGYQVAGYDLTPSPLTDKLADEDIAVHFDDTVDSIPPQFLDPETTRVVYTPAVPSTHSELTYFRQSGFEVIKRAAILGVLSRDKWTMAVAGTHGKTTTTTMVAWFNNQGQGIGSAFLGGVSKNFGSNMVLGSGERLAVEADEFDRSFLQLHPQAAVITSADPDHLDIYGTAQEFSRAFAQFASQVTGSVIIKKGVAVDGVKQHLTYSLDDPSTHYHAQNITLVEGGYYRFDIVTPTQTITECQLGIPGLINVENCVAAVALVDQRGFEVDRLREAIRTFRGVARRFDFHVNRPDRVYMDDYAHHPQELSAMIRSTRNMFPGRHLTVIFQPHLYSRTKDFFREFAQALSGADRVIMLPIYPARELPMEGVRSEMILELITCEKLIVEKSGLTQTLGQLSTDVVVTAGAGDIDRLCSDVAKTIEEKR